MDHESLLSPAREDGSVANWEDDGISTLISQLHQGDFESVLRSAFAARLLGHDDDGQSTNDVSEPETFVGAISRRLERLLRTPTEESPASKKKLKRTHSAYVFLVGYAALHAFLQANITGPPLPFSSAQLLFPAHSLSSASVVDGLRTQLINSLALDGVPAYHLIPAVELFCLAKTIFNHADVEVAGLERMRIRTNFLHQRLLAEPAPVLQSVIYEDLNKLDGLFANERPGRSKDDDIKLLLERVQIHMFYGYDAKARVHLAEAAEVSNFQFALTGKLGKRTKFQENDLSQLVVLACSAAEDDPPEGAERERGSRTSAAHDGSEKPHENATKPKNLDLNDDTLLESISFSQNNPRTSHVSESEDSLSPVLSSLDPSKQPLLRPLDSIILLAFASSITNTSPSDGLTREETLPYATRVLDGGSSNWQIYTQALLVRSRIEGYRSRTQERGLLQLQALVDQVIVETTTGGPPNGDQVEASTATTFFPPSQGDEGASAPERLRYIHQLCSPTRWEVEAELAGRWVSLGGLRTALEIYERLQMWAEIALCYADTGREDKACKVVRKLLFKATDVADERVDEDAETWRGEERGSLPPDASRLFCILGDLEQNPKWYERAWEVSNGRYARAQRSLGKYYFTKRDYARSADAYEKAVVVNALNHATWFALGSMRLQLEQFPRAVECFTRAVQLDDQDGESWSNLAVALLKRGPNQEGAIPEVMSNELDDVDEEHSRQRTERSYDAFRHKKDALIALRRAASLKHDNWRIWENLSIVASSIRPPYHGDVVVATKRIIELRGKALGEKAVDEDSLDMLVRHLVSLEPEPDQSGTHQPKVGLQRMIVELIEKNVIPLITSSRRLWQIVARMLIWQRRFGLALDAYEKAWRTLTSPPDLEAATEERWNDIVEATLELVDAYENLGSPERTDATTVATNWKFKARNAVRGVLGRGKGTWEGTSGWEKLQERLQQLK